MIIVDDLRPEIGAWGNEHIITPSLDKLSEKGFSFRNAFSQYANCSPSRISLMTGLSQRLWDTLETSGQNLNFLNTLPFPDILKIMDISQLQLGKSITTLKMTVNHGITFMI